MSSTYDLMDLYSETNQPKRFSGTFVTSVLVHVAIAAACLLVTPPILELAQAPITIDVLDNAVETPVIKSELAVEDQKSAEPLAVAPKPQASSVAKAKLDTAIKAPVLKSQTQQFSEVKMKTTTGGGADAIAATSASKAGSPATLDDIAAPDLNMDGVEINQLGDYGKNTLENELDHDLKNLDQDTKASVHAAQAALDDDIKNIADDADQRLNGISNDTEQFAKTMNESIEATRSQNAATLNQIKAGELAAAEAARKKQLANAQAAAGAGGGAGVRNLAQLKQMPGNPLPQYSMDERYRKEQGKVVYQAYVSPEGRLTQLKLIQSTGFKNLDEKTSTALSKWKFYPGQEGWVEIPQVWSLVGDTQEMPTTLRRKN